MHTQKALKIDFGGKNLAEKQQIPSRELTYPTLGKGKSSSKCKFWGGYVSSLEGNLETQTILQHCKKCSFFESMLMKWSLREWQSFTNLQIQIPNYFKLKNQFQRLTHYGETEALEWYHRNSQLRSYLPRTRIAVLKGQFIRALISIWGFPKMVVPNNHGFPTKNDHFGVFWGYHHLRKHPFVYRTLQFPVLGPLQVTSSVLRNIFLIMWYHSYAANGNLRLPECRPRNPRWSWRGWACSPQKWRPVRFSIGVWVVEDGGVSSNPFPFYHHWSWLKC